MEVPNKETIKAQLNASLEQDSVLTFQQLNKIMTTCGFETKLLGPVNAMRMIEEITHSGQLLYYWHQGRSSSIQCRLVAEIIDTEHNDTVKISAIKF